MQLLQFQTFPFLSHVAEKAEEVAEEGGGRNQAGFKPEKEVRGII